MSGRSFYNDSSKITLYGTKHYGIAPPHSMFSARDKSGILNRAIRIRMSFGARTSYNERSTSVPEMATLENHTKAEDGLGNHTRNMGTRIVFKSKIDKHGKLEKYECLSVAT